MPDSTWTDGDFGDSANKMNLLQWLFSGPYGAWHMAERCRVCGQGHEYAQSEKTAAPLEGPRRWLCHVCGSSHEHLVTWVGRKTVQGGYWQWLPASRLPPDLQAKREQDALQAQLREAAEQNLRQRLDAEFEVRVKAVVERELELRLQQARSEDTKGEDMIRKEKDCMLVVNREGAVLISVRTNHNQTFTTTGGRLDPEAAAQLGLILLGVPELWKDGMDLGELRARLASTAPG